MTSTHTNVKKLKIFTDFSAFSDQLPIEPFLYPFCQSPNPNSTFDNYIASVSGLFSLSSLNDADIVVLPVNWEIILSLGLTETAKAFIHQAKAAGKFTVSFFGGDCSHLTLPIETDIIFRQSLYDFNRQVNEFAFPAWNEDLLAAVNQGELLIRSKSAKPVVGFCGLANPAQLKTRIKHFALSSKARAKERFSNVKTIPPYSHGHILRAKAIDRLAKSSEIAPNFILRKQSFFSATTSPQDKAQSRLEFVQNMLESDYALCMRGSGNYSFRLYEALCCGRIPLIINTHCVLPCDFDIDWRQYGIWVDESDLPYLDQKVLDFHNSLSPSDFIDLQHRCRELWTTFIEPSGFFKNLYRHVERVNTIRMAAR
jgi:hypothetical protein